MNKRYNILFKEDTNFVSPRISSNISGTKNEIVEGARSDYPVHEGKNENIITEKHNIPVRENYNVEENYSCGDIYINVYEEE